MFQDEEMENEYMGLIAGKVSLDLNIPESGVRNTLSLMGAGGTVPFIARYRKEKTGGLDEVQIRNIGDKFQYYLELQKRKETMINTIREQGKLTPELGKEISECMERQRLEDLYLPYKPKKRTKATVAKEKGLGPLADLIYMQRTVKGPKEELVRPFINPERGVDSDKAAVQGALDIVAEIISDDAEARAGLRGFIWKHGIVVSKADKKWQAQKSKFESYYEFSEPLKDSLSHRILAIRRGAKEEVLNWSIKADEIKAVSLLESMVVTNRGSVFYEELLLAIRDSYQRLLFPSLETEVFLLKIEEAEKEAINVFSKNLNNLLLASPAGNKVILGVDPGFRTGVKLALIDRNGNFKIFKAIYPHGPQSLKQQSEEVVCRLINEHGIELISIGNGTASKETFVFMAEIVRRHNFTVKVTVVNEAGASVYSASEAARREFPELDVTVRGAISIARRLQDPLAELVKIDPKSIGVGQYQHDVNQTELKKSLDGVVESCVNYVGVELNTASAELLSYVAGIGRVIARNIVEYRAKTGSFRNKSELLSVSKLGEKVFEQCAGFLRIAGGDTLLDNSAVHPESYHIVEKMALDLGVGIKEIIGNEKMVSRINPARYVSAEAGLPTLEDILRELKKPGLDPRKEFSSVEFSSAINEIDDLKIGMTLEGVVTNVANFGAFVDIGVHQDGLIHISRLSKKFVKNPHDVIAVGDNVKVKVVSIDKELKRVGLERVG